MMEFICISYVNNIKHESAIKFSLLFNSNSDQVVDVDEFLPFNAAITDHHVLKIIQLFEIETFDIVLVNCYFLEEGR